MDPIFLCQVFFILGASSFLAGTLLPAFRQRIMTYGARGYRNNDPDTTAEGSKRELMLQVIDYVGNFQVPRSWFTHYYITSVIFSAFWAEQILTNGSAFRILAAHADCHGGCKMTMNQVLLAWSMMTAQGIRRLYESVSMSKPSQSKMWVGIWLLGIAYYMVMGISVWIEGSVALTQWPLAGQIVYSAPSLKTLIAIPLFMAGSVVQHHCHRKLASLKKYTLPEGPFFNSIVSPHYTSECVIYVAIAIAAAPHGQLFNRTVLAGLAFVVSNLGITADSTRTWYIEKFGADKLNGRWRMIPFLY